MPHIRRRNQLGLIRGEELLYLLQFFNVLVALLVVASLHDPCMLADHDDGVSKLTEELAVWVLLDHLVHHLEDRSEVVVNLLVVDDEGFLEFNLGEIDAEILRVLLDVLRGDFLQLFLTRLTILPIILDFLLIDLPHQSLEYGSKPFLEDTCLVLVAKVELLHEYEMLVDESAVMQNVHALFEGDAGRKDHVYRLQGRGVLPETHSDV